MTLEYDKILEIIEETKKENPYPEDIFVGKTEEGMRGKASRISWNNACDVIKEKLNEEINYERQISL